MRLKRLVAIGIVLSFGLGLVFAQGQPKEKGLTVKEVLAKAKEAAMGLDRVKIEGESVTGNVSTTKNEGAIDYDKKSFYVVEKDGDKIINAMYLKDGVTYMFNGTMDTWFKFGKELDFFSGMLDKEQLFSFFPEDYKEAGFEIKLLPEEKVGGQPCYVISSTIVDKEKAKEFMVKFLDRFVSEEVAKQIKSNKQLLDNYLDTYVQDSESVQWISKDNFFVLKVNSQNRRTAGPGESVLVENTVRYYDFNEPVSITIPQEALDAPAISGSDLGM